MASSSGAFPLVWFWRKRLPERKGQRCRVLVRACRMNSVLIEFVDGYQVVTSRYAVRAASSAEPIVATGEQLELGAEVDRSRDSIRAELDRTGGGPVANRSRSGCG